MLAAADAAGWTFKIWWALQDLNLGPMDYESTALTAELRARFVFIMLKEIFRPQEDTEF